MTGMIEQVARALSIADGNHPDACSNDEDQQPMWTLYVKDACAAIEAMREPTAAVLEAGPPEPYMDKAVWIKMIDAALGVRHT